MKVVTLRNGVAMLYYPGDRQEECVPKEDAELALIYMREGKTMREIVEMFRSLSSACNVYQAALYLLKNQS